MDKNSKTIELSKVERGFLLGIQQKHQMAMSFELNTAVNDLLETLGLKAEADAGLITINVSPDYKSLTWTPVPKPGDLPEPPTGTPPPPAPVLLADERQETSAR